MSLKAKATLPIQTKISVLIFFLTRSKLIYLLILIFFYEVFVSVVFNASLHIDNCSTRKHFICFSISMIYVHFSFIFDTFAQSFIFIFLLNETHYFYFCLTKFCKMVSRQNFIKGPWKLRAGPSSLCNLYYWEILYRLKIIKKIINHMNTKHKCAWNLAVILNHLIIILLHLLWLYLFILDHLFITIFRIKISNYIIIVVHSHHPLNIKKKFLKIIEVQLEISQETTKQKKNKITTPNPYWWDSNLKYSQVDASPTRSAILGSS